MNYSNLVLEDEILNNIVGGCWPEGIFFIHIRSRKSFEECYPEIKRAFIGQIISCHGNCPGCLRKLRPGMFRENTENSEYVFQYTFQHIRGLFTCCVTKMGISRCPIPAILHFFFAGDRPIPEDPSTIGTTSYIADLEKSKFVYKISFYCGERLVIKRLEVPGNETPQPIMF